PEQVGPGLYCIDVAAGAWWREGRGPAVVAVKPHRNARPLLRDLRAPQQRGRQHRMAVAKNIRPHFDRFAANALDRKPPGIDGRIDIPDEDTAAVTVAEQGSIYSQCGAILHCTCRTQRSDRRWNRHPGALVPNCERCDATELNLIGFVIAVESENQRPIFIFA